MYSILAIINDTYFKNMYFVIYILTPIFKVHFTYTDTFTN